MNPKAHQPDSLPAPGPSALAQSEALVAKKKRAATPAWRHRTVRVSQRGKFEAKSG